MQTDGQETFIFIPGFFPQTCARIVGGGRSFVRIEASKARFFVAGDNCVDGLADPFRGQEEDLTMTHVMTTNGQQVWQRKLH